MKRTGIKQKIFLTLLISLFIFNAFAPSINSDAKAITKTIKINYIDVGQADSILIQNNGVNMLIDAGNRADDQTVINYLKNHGVKQLDYVIITHPHEDHMGGMPAVLNAFKVDKFIMPNVTTNTEIFKTLLTTIKSKGIKITTPVAGTSFKLGDATCNILAPNSSKYDNLNNYSVVIRMVYGKTSFLFEGDAEVQSEKEIIDKGAILSSDVIKLGHHGSRTASSDSYLNLVNPTFAIISCGKGNDYGHPHDETIKKLIQRHITFYRTDVNGSIICTSDGNKISFTTTGSSKPNNIITPDSPNGVTLTGTNANNTTSTTKLVSPSEKNTSGAVNTNTIVYITKTGKDYHTDGCNGLSRSKIAITLGEAIKKGYKPHEQCGAPRLK